MAEQNASLRIAIRDALNGEAILFLGAGAAKDAKTRKGKTLPTGQQLADALAADCGEDAGYPLDSIAQHFLEVKSETALINALRRHLKVSSIGETLLALASVPWLRIWTTNYDDAFEQALDEEKRTHYALTTADQVRNAQGGRLLVLHINGMLKRLNQALTPDFVLTSLGYATQQFADTDWSTVFRNDMQRAKAIIFVGYSLYDIDIARLIFNPALLKKKIHFIDRDALGRVLKTKLSNFGSVYGIGLPAFRELLLEEKAQWEPPKYVEAYKCWSKISPVKSLREPRDDDFYDLIMYGVTEDELLLAQLESPEESTYSVVRSFEGDCIHHLGQPNGVAVAVGSFANGKTIALRSVALQMVAQGRDVFEFVQHDESARVELQKLCERDNDFVVVIENYSRNLELVECFCRYARSDCALLTSARTEVHELRLAALADRTQERDLAIFDLDLLDNDEVVRLTSLFELRGLWGERAGLTAIQRSAYIKHDCGRQLQAFLIDVAKSPQVKRRLDEIVEHFRSVDGGLRVLIALCLLQAIGEEPRTDVAGELLQLSFENFKLLERDDIARRIIAVHSGIARFRSPVMASAILSGLENAMTVTDVVVECVKRGHNSRHADSYLGMISKELMRFANLERMLPERGKRNALQNFYEDLKTVPSIRSNPHYWLQYAMTRLSLGELAKARNYFDQSYSLAHSLSGYDTFQIDNHYSRLLFREAEDTTDHDEAFKLVDQAIQILKKQVLRENRHYPYRSAWNLEGVAKRHGEDWTNEQRASVVNGAKYLIDAAGRLEAHVARSVAVVGGLERLNSVVADLT